MGRRCKEFVPEEEPWLIRTMKIKGMTPACRVMKLTPEHGPTRASFGGEKSMLR